MRSASSSNYGRTWNAVEQYAKSGSAGKKIVNAFLSKLGPVGKILGSMVGNDRQRGSLPSDLKQAVDFLKAFSDEPNVINALERILQGRGAQVVWPGGKPVDPSELTRSISRAITGAIQAAEAGSGGSGSAGRGGSGGQGGGGRGGRGDDGAGSLPPGGGGGGGNNGKVPVNVDGTVQYFDRNHPIVTGEMVETPESSNVYAFGFDNDSHSLFVRFKDSRPANAGGHNIKSVYSGSGQGRPHKAGPLYLYHQCPSRLFLSFISADSKGNWVWDHLRIRGTISGHQLDYALVGVQGGYVPRKATLTPAGEEFIPRSIFTDQGRELSSSLPQELVRPLQPGFRRDGGLGRPPNDGRGGLGGGRGRRR